MDTANNRNHPAYLDSCRLRSQEGLADGPSLHRIHGRLTRNDLALLKDLKGFIMTVPNIGRSLFNEGGKEAETTQDPPPQSHPAADPPKANPVAEPAHFVSLAEAAKHNTPQSQPRWTPKAISQWFQGAQAWEIADLVKQLQELHCPISLSVKF